jgi:hypothetical protein
MERSLKLSEKLFCLSVNPRKGGILWNAHSALGMTLTGCILIELMNQGLISVSNKLVHMESPALQTDEIHEFYLSKMRQRSKDRKLQNWISNFCLNRRKIQKLVIRALKRKNVVRTEERRFLFIPYEKVFLMDRQLAETIRKEVEDAILGKGKPDENALALAKMVWRTNLLPSVFPDRSRRREAVKILKAIPESEVTKAVFDAIRMAQAATAAAVS